MIEARQLPMVIPAKGRLTEYEVRVAGLTSSALIVLNAMSVQSASGGKLTTSGGEMALTQNDVQAVLSLLIERGENLLINLDIQLDREG
jgi:hypothetical protein